MAMTVTYDGNHPDHDVGEEGDPEHAEEEGGQIPIPPLLQTTVGHCVVTGHTQRQIQGPRHQLTSIALRHLEQRNLLFFCHLVHPQCST